MVKSGSSCLQPSAKVFFVFLRNKSAIEVMQRGRERSTDYVERLFDKISLDQHR
jgi:hypothetical protein